MTTTTAAFRTMGITDEVTTCECCGRAELKATVIVGVLDEDGNVTDTFHFGRTCAAKAAGRTVKQIDAELATVAKAERAEREQRDNARRFAEHQAYESWKLATFGDTKDTLERHRRHVDENRSRAN